MTPGFWDDEPAWLRCSADPRVFVVACAWLFVLVVLGTLAQRELGLYVAQGRYFDAWLLWLGPVPLPGGRLTLALTGLNLLANLFTRRGSKSPGLFLLHAGTLLLLAGSLLVSAYRIDGSLALFEGESGDEMRSWHHHELGILISGGTSDQLITFGEGRLQPGAVLSHPLLPLTLRVEQHLANCRPHSGGLEALPLELEAERNLAGVSLRLPDGRLLSASEAGAPIELAPGLSAGIRRLGTRLPFAIKLERFQRDNHPGTGMAKSFSSAVVVHEADSSRRVVISMNRPLRIGPWTLYQQSYSETENGTASVLAVVRDRFQLSPYLASGVMLLGLLLHLYERLRRTRGAP